MKIKQHTVNVIEMVGDGIMGLRAFTECHKGNKRAEKLFRRLIKEYEANLEPDDLKSTKEDVADCLDEAMYEKADYKLMLVHST